MNGNLPKSHTATVLVCITWLATLAACGGMWLLWKGFQGGTEMVVTLNTAISGLIGFLGGRATSGPASTTINNPPTEPVPVAPIQPVITKAP